MRVSKSTSEKRSFNLKPEPYINSYIYQLQSVTFQGAKH